MTTVDSHARAQAAVRNAITAVRPDQDADSVTLEKSLRDLGYDSLDRLDVVVGALEALGLLLRPDRLAAANTIGELVEVLVAELARADG